MLRLKRFPARADAHDRDETAATRWRSADTFAESRLAGAALRLRPASTGSTRSKSTGLATATMSKSPARCDRQPKPIACSVAEGEAQGMGRRDPRVQQDRPLVPRRLRDCTRRARCPRSRPCRPDAGQYEALKASGFSDGALRLTATPKSPSRGSKTARRSDGVQPHRHLRAEFLRYGLMYSTTRLRSAGKVRCYEADPSEREKDRHPRGGPTRIGQGIEFDLVAVATRVLSARRGLRRTVPDQLQIRRPCRRLRHFRRLDSSRGPRGRAWRSSIRSGAGLLKGVRVANYGGQTPLS